MNQKTVLEKKKANTYISKHTLLHLKVKKKMFLHYFNTPITECKSVGS